MKIRYLTSTRADSQWFRYYYDSVFSEGGLNAKKQFLKSEKLLLEYPQIGFETEIIGIRKLNIPKTSFSFIYRISDETIEVLRLWDNRKAKKIKNNIYNGIQ